MPTAIVVLAEGFEEIEAITPIDILRRAEVDVTTAGLGTTSVTGSHGITVQADTTLNTISTIPDVLVLPGGPGAAALGESTTVETLTKQTFEAGKLCAAICAAPALTLGRFGILEGKRATCFPSFENHLGPTTTFTEERVVIDGNVITSRGAGTAMEFSLAIVATLFDAETAASLSDRVLAQA